jgi:hypothetical protein
MPTLEETVALEGMSNDEALQAGLLYSRLLKNPATRNQALALMKAGDPNLHIPEVDIPQQFQTAMKPLADELAELKKKNEELTLATARKGILEDLVSDGLAENIAEAKVIEKFAVDHKIADYKEAANFYRMSQQQAAPTPDTMNGYPGTMELPIDFKEIAKNPRGWARKMAVSSMAEFKKSGGKAA